MQAATLMRTPVEPADDAPHLLLVDDDRRIRDLLSRFLSGEGYRVTTAMSATDARAKLLGLHFDLLILDVMMPGENGFDYARRVRKTSRVPILMLTARSNPNDRVMGLEIGADDYLPKPFEPRELILRLTNIINRAGGPGRSAGGDVVTFGPFAFRIDRGELRRGEEMIRITEREREILTILANAAGGSVERHVLAGDAAGERTLDVQINRLRRKTEVDPGNPTFLQTVRGVGYRLAVD